MIIEKSGIKVDVALWESYQHEDKWSFNNPTPDLLAIYTEELVT